MTNRRQRTAAVLAWLLAALLTATGTLHFLAPDGFAAIVPRFLGHPRAWVQASGAVELACALAIAARPTRHIGGTAAAVLFVLVFPANVQMALDSGGAHAGLLHTPVVAWGRLPLQIPLIGWALVVARQARTSRGPGTRR